jgi:menaquinone-9 beta-reductase
MRRDPLIIGGGPAGCAAAITLARAGHRPTLLERTTGPTDKVCGDFLSLDTILHARSFRVDPAALGAAPIGRVRLIHRDRVAETELPFPAFGLSRRTLDAALLNRARDAGAIVRTGQTVRRLTRDGDAWTIEIAGQDAMSAETVFLATGKHDLRGHARVWTGQGAVGLKTYLTLAPESARKLEGATELTLFPGGYAGMQCVENGRVVLCIAVQQTAFLRYGGAWTGLTEAIGRHSPRFAAMLSGSHPLLHRPLAVAGVPYGYQARPGGLFRLGDQAAVIPSLTGDGMAIALHSGQHAAEAWLANQVASTYQRTLALTLAPQMRLAGWLHRAGISAVVQAASVPLMRFFPALPRLAATRTRLPNPIRPTPIGPPPDPSRPSGRSSPHWAR